MIKIVSNSNQFSLNSFWSAYFIKIIQTATGNNMKLMQKSTFGMIQSKNGFVEC